MEDLIGKTIVAVKQISDYGDWDEDYELVCSDGTKFLVGSRGAAYCSSYLKVEKLKE